MSRFLIGSSGALCVDEKLHMHSLVRQDAEPAYVFSDMLFAIADDRGKAFVLDEDFAEVKCKSAFLGASYKFEDEAFSAKISASVMTPFGFGNDAHLPAAAFSFKIKNASKKTRNYTFAVLAENFLDNTLQECVETKQGKGVRMSSAHALSFHSEHMTHCVLMDEATKVVRYLERENARDSFMQQLRSGEIEDIKYGVPAQRDCAAVYCKFSLASGESKIVQVVYTWHMPNLRLAQDDTILLVKDARLALFRDSTDVAEYVLENKERLLGFSRQCTKIVREHADSRALEFAVWDNLRTIGNSMVCVFNEPATSKLFLKNRYGAQKLYLEQIQSVYPATVYFDFDSEVESLAWAFEYAVDADGRYNGLPHVRDAQDDVSLQTQIMLQMSLAWRVYRLYVLSGDVQYISRFWTQLERVLAYVHTAGWVREGESVLGIETDGKIVYHLLWTEAYLLSLLCMQKMADLMDLRDLASAYAKSAAEGQAFVRRNFFNGRFYNETFPEDGGDMRCSSMQRYIMQIGKTLGLDVADIGQNAIALDGIYALNYFGDEESGVHGIQTYADTDVFDCCAEILYAHALMQEQKVHLASLVCKAQYVRVPEAHESTSECLLVNALFGYAYNAVERCLTVGKNGTLCFAKNTLISATGDKTQIIRVLGEPIKIDSLIYAGKGRISRVFYSDMELLYVRDGDTVHLNAPLVLSEGEELKIIL